MAKYNTVRFRVDNEQLSRLKSNASEKGFVTLSDYLREISLNENKLLNNIFIKLYELNCSIKRLEDVQNGKTKS